MIANCTRVGWYTELRREWSFSHSFLIDEWELSRSSVSFLDVVIFKDPESPEARARAIQWAPRWKATSLGVPLGEDSRHPSFVQGWMQAELGRLARISSCHEHFEEAKSIFISRLARYHVSGTTLTKLREADPFLHSLVRKALHVHPSPAAPSLPPPCSPPPLVLPLSFHSAWVKGDANRIFHRYCEDPTRSSMLKAGWSFPWTSCRIAWRNGSQHLVHRVRRWCMG